MANERNNEKLVRDALVALGYYESDDITVEEQQSKAAAVRRLLKSAGKSGSGGGGYPEFIVTSLEDDDVVLIIECKASKNRLASPSLDKPVEYALDGALHYARALSKEYHVVAIGSAGETKREWKVATYLHAKGAAESVELKARSSAAINKIVSWNDYRDAFTYDPAVKRKRIEDLMAVSRSMHNFMRDYAKLAENEKPLLVSGTLIALMNPVFRMSYSEHKADKLQAAWLSAITEQIEDADIPRAKKNNITQPYSGIAVHPELGRPTPKYPKGPLHELIRLLDHEVMPLMDVYHDYDVVGQFYGEFLKYTGGDKKSLGIVLTPRHITDLFSRLAQVSKDDVVVDICAGTGGFLIAAMARMLGQCVTENERLDVKRNRLIGVEHQPNMYTLAASNMLLRGDGKANLYQGSCFDTPNVNAIKNHHRDGEPDGSLRPNIGMLNPPYSQKGEGLHELDFVTTMLDVLAPGGLGFAIIPVSCATGTYGKENLLQSHRLEAVMSMPPELFSPVGVVTCVMVFRAHTPHANTPDFKTWFGYWREDGFIKTKHMGRIDAGGWESIRDHWVDSFVNRTTKIGESVLHKVTAADEWTAEAYMETDYAALTEADFEKVVQNYALYMLTRDLGGGDLEDTEDEGVDDVDDSDTDEADDADD
ncbi:type I restriction-modification system methyltransferase subunit [Mycobacteroides abscessus subsp. massiliense]|nr:type I restriction-modification system methyltransferase subunit [Mycobacteroides abscessus subsp. massiliense]